MLSNKFTTCIQRWDIYFTLDKFESIESKHLFVRNIPRPSFTRYQNNPLSYLTNWYPQCDCITMGYPLYTYLQYVPKYIIFLHIPRTFVIFTNLDKRTHRLTINMEKNYANPLSVRNVTNEMSKKDVEVKIK